MGAATAVLTFALLEGALRVIGWPDPGIYAGDPAGLWTLRPDMAERPVRFEERDTTFLVRTNAYGWRDDAPASGATLCLGDSTTFGWGVAEGEAWPARLEARAGAPVTNAGVPGYTTHQGRQTLTAALATKPSRVILAFLVRDADHAPLPDAARPPSRPPPDLQLLRAVRTLRPRATSQGGPAFRVPPRDYAANLAWMIEQIRAVGADPYILAFPMLTAPVEHLAALAGLSAPVWSPTLDRSAFFAEDPVHLTPEGNDRLAAWIAAELSRSAE